MISVGEPSPVREAMAAAIPNPEEPEFRHTFQTLLSADRNFVEGFPEEFEKIVKALDVSMCTLDILGWEPGQIPARHREEYRLAMHGAKGQIRLEMNMQAEDEDRAKRLYLALEMALVILIKFSTPMVVAAPPAPRPVGPAPPADVVRSKKKVGVAIVSMTFHMSSPACPTCHAAPPVHIQQRHCHPRPPTPTHVCPSWCPQGNPWLPRPRLHTRTG